MLSQKTVKSGLDLAVLICIILSHDKHSTISQLACHTVSDPRIQGTEPDKQVFLCFVGERDGKGRGSGRVHYLDLLGFGI